MEKITPFNTIFLNLQSNLTKFYTLYKSEIDSMTTNKLNRLYKINNYKITRRKIGDNEEKTLCFQLIKPDLTQSDENRFQELELTLTSLELENNKIKQHLIEIIKVINSNSQIFALILVLIQNFSNHLPH